MSSIVLVPSLVQRAGVFISKKRELPILGKILVKVGERVTPESIIGEALLPGDLSILKVAEQCEVLPSEMIRGITVAIGDTVSVGQKIFFQKRFFGLFSTEFISTASGVVEFISEHTGHVGVRHAPRKITVKSYIGGTVSEIVEGKSVTIESTGTVIQGVCGVGGETTGIVHALPVTENQTLTAELLRPEESYEGKILCGGMSPTTEFLQRCAEKKVAGVVCGSIEDTVLESYIGYPLGIAMTGDEKVPFPLVITEGFGKIPLSPHLTKLFKANDTLSCSLSGITQIRAGATRPELIITQPSAQLSKIPPAVFEIGSRVRCLRVPYFGERGEILDLPVKPQKIETGAEVRICKIKLASGKEALVPRANLELEII